MKAIEYKLYGAPDVLEIKELNKPVAKDNEILIRIHATTVTSADCRIRSLTMPRGFGLISRLVFGIRRPRKRVLGTELAGVVEAIGKDVATFKPGDAVFGICGMGMGCHAQYKCLAETGAVVGKPDTLSFAEAAALPFGGLTALDFFRRGHLQKGEKVLINGASGSVGTAAIQIARHHGAEITAVCSGANAELVRSLGADHVIDYTRSDFTESGETWDVIVDTVGTAPYSRCKQVLNPGGRLLAVLGDLPALLKAPWITMTSPHKVIAGPAPERKADLVFLVELVRKGQFKPVIERCYPFAQIADAHRHVDTGRKRGNVVIQVNNTDAVSAPLPEQR